MRPTSCQSTSDGAHRLRDPGVVAGLAERQADELAAVDALMCQGAARVVAAAVGSVKRCALGRWPPCG